MARDVRGTSRANMFETVVDADTGERFSPVRGTATHTTYRSDRGADEITLSSERRSGRDITQERAWRNQIDGTGSPQPTRAGRARPRR